jgi:Cu/Ag efflux pump CusA
MMRWMVGSAVHFGRLVIAAAVAVMVVGVIQLRDAPVDTYPQFTPPTVQIQTEALGLSAAEVEQLITVPLEQDLLNGIPWLETITSESMPGLSSIDMVFEPGTDLLRARQMTQERLTQAHALPNVGSSPIMIQPLSSTGRVMMISLSSKALSTIDMSVLARWQIKPKLMGVPGVANVAIWGQHDRQLQVLVDPKRLAKNKVSLNQVIDTTGNALWVSPLTFVEASTPGTGGFVDTPNQRFGVQHVFPINTASQLSSVTIEDTGGKRLRLSDVANVVEDHQPPIGGAAVGDSEAVVLVVQKFPGMSTTEVTKAVEEAMTSLQPGLTDVTVNTKVFRPATFIQSALDNVAGLAIISLALVIAMLGLLFLSWRVALIGAVTVPLSLIAAGSVLLLTGTTFSALVLAGLVAALSVVIHNTVTSVEAIRRRLRDPSADQGSKVGHVVAATVDTWGPLTYATVALVLGVVPALLLTGTAGLLTGPMVASYLLAVLASLVVSLTVTPAMAVWLITPDTDGVRTPARRRASRLQGAMTRTGDRGLDAVSNFIHHPRRAYALIGVLVVAAFVAVPQFDRARLLPGLEDRDLLIKVNTMSGTSLSETSRITAAASQELRGVAGVDNVGVHAGRAVTSDQVVNVNSAEMWVHIKPAADLAATRKTIDEVMDGYPGVAHTLSTYTGERLAAAQAGPDRPVVVRVYGPDLPTLKAQAEKVRGVLSSISGVRDARAQVLVEEPSLQVQVDLAKAQHYGIRPGDVRRAAGTLLSGLPVGNTYEEQKIFDVVVWSNETSRHSIANVENLAIDLPAGGSVPLKAVAKVRLAPFPISISHRDVSRSLDVTADVGDRDVAAVQDDVTNRLAAMRFPLEYRAEVSPGSADSAQPTRATIGFMLAAAIAIFLLLQAATSSWRLGAVLLLTLPLAAAGGLAAGAPGDNIASLGGVLGLLAVLALAIRANLLLFRRFQDLRLAGTARAAGTAGRAGTADARSDRDLVIRGTWEQAWPVLTTALITAAAFLPFAVSGSIAGAEILHPMAVVVLGGLLTSTALTLLILPVLYLVLGSGRQGSASAASGAPAASAGPAAP